MFIQIFDVHVIMIVIRVMGAVVSIFLSNQFKTLQG